MALSASRVSQLRDVLTNIDQSQLRDRELQFVKDQARRFEEYGSEMFLSDKQWSWLESIYEKQTGEKPTDKQSPGGRDLDDETPF